MNLPPEIERFDSTMALLLNQDNVVYSNSNAVDVYVHGEDKFAAFKEAIKSAEHHIHMEYYILRGDELGREIIDLLTERAAAGVKVRVLFDAVGVQKVKREFFANYAGFVSLIGHARKSIYIHSPYFIPDETICTSLLMAIRSGIDVRIVIPCKPDHPFVYWASYSYLGDLIRAGAKGYTYDNGFIHSKTAIIDGVASAIDTANWDIRSFKLNFETDAFVYDEAFGRKMDEIMLREMEEKCTQVTVEMYNNRPKWIKFKEGICRLVSPLL